MARRYTAFCLRVTPLSFKTCLAYRRGKPRKIRHKKASAMMSQYDCMASLQTTFVYFCRFSMPCESTQHPAFAFPSLCRSVSGQMNYMRIGPRLQTYHVCSLSPPLRISTTSSVRRGGLSLPFIASPRASSVRLHILWAILREHQPLP